MSYNKPEITSLASAGSVIQGLPKAIVTTPDSHGAEDRVTQTAYESDE